MGLHLTLAAGRTPLLLAACFVGLGGVNAHAQSTDHVFQPPISAVEPATAPTNATPTLVARLDPAPEPAQESGSSPNSTTRVSVGKNYQDDLFAGTEKFAKNASQATEVNMTPDDLDEVRGPHAPRAHATLLNTVHEYQFDKPGMYSMADVDEFRHKLQGPGWHCSIHTRDLKTGGSTDVCSKQRGDELKESAIITVSPKSLTFIHRIERVGPHNKDEDNDSD